MSAASAASTGRENTLNAVINLARACDYDAAHTHQVLRLSLRLFEELYSLHQLEETERDWLEYAALLHDIGWVEGVRAHHKTALNMILSTPLLPFDSKERLIIGSIARYHRKALPSLEHDHFAALDPEEREIVKKLAAILRVADGLDAAHQRRVQDVSAKIRTEKVTLTCLVIQPAPDEAASAARKADLFEQVYGARLAFKWKQVKEG